jgi:hypothetical protein
LSRKMTRNVSHQTIPSSDQYPTHVHVHCAQKMPKDSKSKVSDDLISSADEEEELLEGEDPIAEESPTIVNMDFEIKVDYGFTREVMTKQFRELEEWNLIKETSYAPGENPKAKPAKILPSLTAAQLAQYQPMQEGLGAYKMLKQIRKQNKRNAVNAQLTAKHCTQVRVALQEKSEQHKDMTKANSDLRGELEEKTAHNKVISKEMNKMVKNSNRLQIIAKQTTDVLKRNKQLMEEIRQLKNERIMLQTMEKNSRDELVEYNKTYLALPIEQQELFSCINEKMRKSERKRKLANPLTPPTKAKKVCISTKP